jgi:hypothetical protein
MNIAITGSHGFVGTARLRRPRAEGHRAELEPGLRHVLGKGST